MIITECNLYSNAPINIFTDDIENVIDIQLVEINGITIVSVITNPLYTKSDIDNLECSVKEYVESLGYKNVIVSRDIDVYYEILSLKNLDTDKQDERVESIFDKACNRQ